MCVGGGGGGEPTIVLYFKIIYVQYTHIHTMNVPPPLSYRVRTRQRRSSEPAHINFEAFLTEQGIE